MKKVFVYLWKLAKTRTVWVNLLGGVLQIINANSGELIPVEIATALQFGVNVLIRAITNKSVSEK